MTFENRYSVLDRLLHRLAFATARTQIGLAELEDRMFGEDLAGIEVRRPVFITALPRAGTTLLLELCAALDEFATHCYRDMPFVLLPLMWNRFSKGFRQSDQPRERAHGDGMLISVDSPEAFEEMIWRAMWPNQYRPESILPWDTRDNPEFLDFFLNPMRKIARLRQRHPTRTPRYVSKNNFNIARIEWLAEALPEAIFVVPFREPTQHAASLLRQHLNFLDIHERDSFSRAYMAGIGHFDFGANLRPIDFGEWLATARHQDPRSMGFWLEYWAAAYGHLLDRRNARVHFLSYEAFCADPDRGLARLADVLSLDDRDGLMAKREDIRAAKPHAIELTNVGGTILARIEDVHARLKDNSIVPCR